MDSEAHMKKASPWMHYFDDRVLHQYQENRPFRENPDLQTGLPRKSLADYTARWALESQQDYPDTCFPDYPTDFTTEFPADYPADINLSSLSSNLSTTTVPYADSQTPIGEVPPRRKWWRACTAGGILLLLLVPLAIALLLHFHYPKEDLLSMVDTGVIFGDDVVLLDCRVGKIPPWREIIILRDDENEVLANLTLTPNLVTWIKDPARMELRQTLRHDHLSIVLSLKNPSCSDQGVYLCQAMTEKKVYKATARVNVTVRPRPPELYLPAQIVDGKPFLVRNVWHAGYPRVLGYLVVEHLSADKSALPVPVFADYTESIRSSNCSIVLEDTYTFLPNMSWNGTRLRVSVFPHSNLPEESKWETLQLRPAEKQIMIFRADICKGTGDSSTRPHPYTCDSYIQCIGGEPQVVKCLPGQCFDVISQKCGRHTGSMSAVTR